MHLGQVRPPASPPDPVGSRRPQETEPWGPQTRAVPVSGLASSVGSGLPKKVPPRVPSRAETKQDGPVAISVLDMRGKGWRL